MMPKIIPAIFLTILVLQTPSPASTTYYISPTGNDTAAGTDAAPFATLQRARDAIRELKSKGALPVGGIQVVVHGGTYHLDQTLVFTADDSGSTEAPIDYYIAAPTETVVISGGRRLELKWEPYKNGIFQASVPGVKEGKVDFDQLFLDGQLQHLARYPNFDPNARNYNGTAADCLSPKRVKTWAHPETAILHALHGNEWGDLHYRVTGVDAKGNAILEGGWQNNRGSGPHHSARFVENVFEELDAAGEWFLDKSAGTLYFMPPADVDLAKAKIEVAGLIHLIDFQGTKDKPVKFISLFGFTFTHAGRTFLGKYEPLLRTDWAIYRGGAIFMQGTENCTIAAANFENLGGNALFVSGYNRRAEISGCRFTNIGASAVCFVGETSAVRSATSWSQGADWATVDRTPGPKTDDYPADCKVIDCLMHHFGTVEKQVAGVEIDMAARINVSHCSIYDCPRAGINIGDGCWGGHVIEFCDVFDTVKETGDHGSFNAWGRDRFWQIHTPAGKNFDELVAENPNLPEWDCMEPITLANNRWRCDHGWDIDLDDGSSNYHIYNNVCLHGGLKNREGFDRIVENNILVNCTFHPHVWYKNNRGVFRNNIVMDTYKPIGIKNWDAEVDRNIFMTPAALKYTQDNWHTDANSVAGDPMFVDPENGDYQVKEDSIALKAGFKNFPMDQFGVGSPRLKSEAATPRLTNGPESNTPKVDPKPHAWLGGTVRNVVGLGDRSAFGLPDETGVIVVDAAEGSELKKIGLAKDDVIVGLGKKTIHTIHDLAGAYDKLAKGSTTELRTIRGQKEQKLTLER